MQHKILVFLGQSYSAQILVTFGIQKQRGKAREMNDINERKDLFL